MNRDEIIKLAKEAGWQNTAILQADLRGLTRFAALVAAAERERCAKVCDDRVTAYRYATDSWAQEHIDEARYLSAAIRARGQV